MGASMAETFAKFGYEVICYDIFEAALERAENLISINQETEREHGLVSAEESEALMKRIKYTTNIQELAVADFVVEAVLEKLDIKHKFWEEASRVVPEDAVLCSNTSGLSFH